MEDSDHYMECPVCGKKYLTSSLNKHVNECLNSAEESAFETSPKTSSKKRKSGDAWGCLQLSNNNASNATSSRKGPRIKFTKKKFKADTNRFKSSENPSKSSAEVTEIESDADSDLQVVGDDSDCELSELTRTDSKPITQGTFLRKEDPNNKQAGAYDETWKRSSTSCQPCIPKVSSVENNFSLKSSSNSSITKTDKPSVIDLKKNVPLAEAMRPKCLEDFVGQTQSMGKNSMLRNLLQSDQIPSMILWGPPGCGKTTLARIVANSCKEKGSYRYVSLSATSSGVADVKEVLKSAKNDQRMLKRKTILFLHEIHRFSKSQQDTLLPGVEDGTIILIGATTENPSFRVNSALISRSRVIVLEKLSSENIMEILKRTVKCLGLKIIESQNSTELYDEGCDECIYVEQDAIEAVANLCDGDARGALNGFQMAVQSVMSGTPSSQHSKSSTSHVKMKHKVINTELIKDGLQRSHLLYDKTGEEHYNCISALHKSIRGSDASAALYWTARMLEGGEDPLYVARRLVRAASEDIGLADPLALNQAVATYQACHFIGMPECEVIIAQCATYLARAPKSVEVYTAYRKAKSCIKNHQGPVPSVPLHLRNAPTTLMKSLGYGKNYQYNPDYDEPVDQEYFPECLKGTNFFK